MLDDLEWLLHNACGLSTRHEAMVRCIDAHRGYQTNTAVADVTTVKVPEMAESITEGTLKQWSKRMGISPQKTHAGILMACRGWRLR